MDKNKFDGDKYHYTVGTDDLCEDVCPIDNRYRIGSSACRNNCKKLIHINQNIDQKERWIICGELNEHLRRVRDEELTSIDKVIIEDKEDFEKYSFKATPIGDPLEKCPVNDNYYIGSPHCLCECAKLKALNHKEKWVICKPLNNYFENKKHVAEQTKALSDAFASSGVSLTEAHERSIPIEDKKYKYIKGENCPVYPHNEIGNSSCSLCNKYKSLNNLYVVCPTLNKLIAKVQEKMKKKEKKLNPYIIETRYICKHEVELKLVNINTGEIKQKIITVEELNKILDT